MYSYAEISSKQFEFVDNRYMVKVKTDKVTPSVTLSVTVSIRVSVRPIWLQCRIVT